MYKLHSAIEHYCIKFLEILEDTYINTAFYEAIPRVYQRFLETQQYERAERSKILYTFIKKSQFRLKRVKNKSSSKCGVNSIRS